eukprot:CAMPEP_0119434730 /NCGR_PEP_ID=MMETSP1335-20130426/50813_1 /TAXON_ID=259385 /ORGANISM="Chrysoculter rhomboideus, Strain RCC1486" /LENGTH=209 /DNA_ID=CAMNT_0007460585 /DNA_START=71 /DNA_END=701 /DNA_ORIENTATION=+
MPLVSRVGVEGRRTVAVSARRGGEEARAESAPIRILLRAGLLPAVRRLARRVPEGEGETQDHLAVGHDRMLGCWLRIHHSRRRRRGDGPAAVRVGHVGQARQYLVQRVKGDAVRRLRAAPLQETATDSRRVGEQAAAWPLAPRAAAALAGALDLTGDRAADAARAEPQRAEHRAGEGHEHGAESGRVRGCGGCARSVARCVSARFPSKR